jgi:hypothetical protein
MTFSTRRFVALAAVSFVVSGCDSPPSAPLPRIDASATHSSRSLNVSDGEGKVWRQLIETTGLSWTQVAEVCPQDGATPCTGIVGGRDLRGWIWGTSEQVTTLLAHYEPGILTSPTVSGGIEVFFTAENFFASFRPTFSFALTYQAGQNASGWTASTDTSGAPISAGVGNGHASVSASGSFSVTPVADPNEVSQFRGVFLWHSAGSGEIDAVNDAGSTNTGGGTAVANVLANDVFAGAPPSLGQVTLTLLTSSDEGVTLDLTDGSVDVAAGVSTGVKRLEYSICESSAPTNCDHATATITVVPYVIDAVNDAGSVNSTAGGTAVGDVLANDRFNGAQATTANVVLSAVSTTNDGVTLDATDGSVDVAAGTPGGTYTLAYRICEPASPTNCDQATVTVTVVPQMILASPSTLTVYEGGSGSVTVRLSQQPSADVVVSVAFFQGTATVTPSTSAITLGPANWNTGEVVTFQASSDADKDNNAGTINLSSPGIATAPVVVQVVDVNQPAQYPQAMLEAPLNGQTVSGLVNLSGTGTDSNGQVVEARFSVDGNSIFKDKRTATSFRTGWNTRTVANGWHTLELRVIDNTGNDGRMLIKVFVNNEPYWFLGKKRRRRSRRRFILVWSLAPGAGHLLSLEAGAWRRASASESARRIPVDDVDDSGSCATSGARTRRGRIRRGKAARNRTREDERRQRAARLSHSTNGREVVRPIGRQACRRSNVYHGREGGATGSKAPQRDRPDGHVRVLRSREVSQRRGECGWQRARAAARRCVHVHGPSTGVKNAE